MLLANVVGVSRRIAETTKRLEKVNLLAGLLKQLHGNEIEIGAAFLSGSTRQGRIGIGYATLRDAITSAAENPSLELLDIDRTLEGIAAVQGSGSEQRRRDLLQTTFTRATKEEQNFLTRLLLGELRQGALEGLMLDSLAKASGLRAERIRRAAMVAGGAAQIART